MAVNWNKRGSSRAVLAFTSHYEITKTKKHRYEWGPTFSEGDCDVLHLRDEGMHWYLNGIPGYADSTNEAIDKLIDDLFDYDEIMTVGASMGGYAAVLFGTLLSEEMDVAVHAFGPQTNLTPDFHGMNSWMDMKIKTKVDPIVTDDTRKYLRLRDIVVPRKTLDCHVYFSSGRKYDAKSAVDVMNGSVLHCIDGTDHNVARVMSKMGRLKSSFGDWAVK